MEEKQIPFFVHEADMTRMERSNHRLWVLCIVLMLILVATNAGWIWYESQWEVIDEDITQTVTQEGSAEDGSVRNIFVGGNNGESETDSYDTDTPQK